MSGAHVNRRSMGQRVLALLTVVLLMFFILETLAPAARADTFTLDLGLLVLHGEPGSDVVIYDGPMPVSGQECELTLTNAANNTSVHENNDIRLESNGQVVTFFDVERAPNVDTPGDQTIVPGANGVLILTFGEDHEFSAHLSLVFDCTPVSTTTTTIETTSTTVIDPTTTTVDDGTTTTIDGTTTTSIEGSSTSTTIDDTSTTTVEDEVLDTEVLPFTGADSGGIALLALSLLSAGALIVTRFKEREEN